MKKYLIATLGCRTNQYESQLFSDQLRQKGWGPVQEGEAADLCIINTCSVTDQADASSRHRIRSIAKEHPHARLIVTGCMAKQAAGIDARVEVMSNQDKEQLISRLLEEDVDETIERFDGRTRAFVKVQDGCNSFCTYCIVPYVRGRSRSRAIPVILKEVETLISRGYREVVLTGINIGDYRTETGKGLASLIRAVDEVEGVERLRISSIDPNLIDAATSEAILCGRSVCPNLHLVLQSGSNRILQRMNRKYTRELFLETVLRFKQGHRDFTITTDIIVGFPGESESDFEETLDVVRQVQFAKVHLFVYSPRSQTKAALYPDRVPADIVRERKEKLFLLADEMALQIRQTFLGRRMKVLLEEGDGEFLTGHTDNFLSVRIPRGTHHSNEWVEVDLVKNGPEGLLGVVV